jgi:type I restriction enzyme R subunit
VVETVSKLSSHRFAVIIDEAHSSQGGINAAKLNMALVAEGEEELSVQEMINKYVQDRKMSPNASFFAFTATPKNSTLERFGTLQRKVVAGKEVLDLVEGKKQYRPFHEYTMKQAIEEGFILDVTANYTTYRSYYELQKSIAENPRFQTTKAQKKLRSYVEGHRETIKVKAEIIVQHFLKQVVTPRRLKGQGKGMVVTRSIENAIL